MGNDCSSLSGNASPCKISACVSYITSLPANSASPTETFIVTMKRNTHYKSYPVEKAFMKIWQNGKSLQNMGLSMEMRIYRDVVKTFIDDNTCPFFVRYLAGSEDCSFEDLCRLAELNFIKPSGENDLRKFRVSVQKRLLRNLFFLDRNLQFRPALSEPIPFTPDEKKEEQRSYAKEFISQPNFFLSQRREVKERKYSFLITELVTPFKTLSNLSDFKLNMNEMLAIFLQITYTIFVMASVKMNHGDLHLGNVLLKEYPQVIQIVFHNKTTVTFFSKINTQIYDFDRSSVQSLGPNPLLKTYPGPLSTNEFIENKDLIYVFNQIYSYYSNEKIRNLIISLLCTTQESIDAFKLLGPHFRVQEGSLKFVKRDFFDMYKSPRVVLNKLMDLIDESDKEPDLVLTCGF